MQKLFAVAIMSVIPRLLMQVAYENTDNQTAESQFKHAVNTFANDIALLTAERPKVAIEIFKELLQDIARIRYYKAKTKRQSELKLSKKPWNKWTTSKNIRTNIR